MRLPRSLQARLALAIGAAITVLWLAAAAVTSTILRGEMSEVFDSALQETAQRLLPLAVVDIMAREEEGVSQSISALRDHEEYFSYLVRDKEGRILLRSHDAEEAGFPPFREPGFDQTATHRLYFDSALQDTITITVAEPLAHRREVARETQLALGLPLLLLIPLSLLGVFTVVRASLRPVVTFRDRLADRGAGDLSPISDAALPSELAPVGQALDGLLARLRRAIEAERSFAANAAHELRTPVAAALAQTQRLIREAPETAPRAREIEASLKRLTRLSEKLMQLARAEGARLRSEQPSDLRPVLQMVVEDARRAEPGSPVSLRLPEAPLLCDIDRDAFAILARNLIENAQRHGGGEQGIEVELAAPATLIVANPGPPIPPDLLATLSQRFARGTSAREGSGLGLSIVQAIAANSGARFTLTSPRTGRADGVEARVDLARQPEAAAD